MGIHLLGFFRRVLQERLVVRKADGCYLFRSHGFKIHTSVLSRSPSKAGTLPHLLFFIDFTWVRERAGGLWFCLLIDSAAVIGSAAGNSLVEKMV